MMYEGYVSAVFRPKRVDDLRPGQGTEALIGRRFTWYYAWTNEDGTVAFLSYDEEWPGLWVPAEDLSDPEPVTVLTRLTR